MRIRHPVPNGGGVSVQCPVGGGRFGLAFVFVLGSCEFETDSVEGSGVDFAGGGELSSAACPCDFVASGGRWVGVVGGSVGRGGRVVAAVVVGVASAEP